MIESFDEHLALWVSSFEAFRQAQHSPALREQLFDSQEEGRYGLVALLQKVEESTVDERSARTVGSFYLALISGLIVQWFVDPDRTPSGSDIADALPAILGSVQPPEKTELPST